jgi:hypothetical protein
MSEPTLPELRTAMFNARDEFAEALYAEQQHPSNDGREYVDGLGKKLIALEKLVMKAGGAI